MSTWLFEFSLPYYSLLLTGSYALMQNFQAMGWASIWQGPVIDLSFINTLAAIYLVFLPVIYLLNVLAASVLSGRLAIIITLAWLVPGVLSLSGLYTIRAVVPETYIIGSGGAEQLGSVQGALVNSILLMLIGWSLSTLVLHAIRAGKKSKSVFDHLWYMLGLTAVVFYVSDATLKSTADQAAAQARDLSSGFSVLRPQFAKTSVRCGDVSFAAGNPILCTWVKEARAYMDHSAQENWVERKYDDAPSSSVLFELLRRKGIGEQQVIEALRAYNRLYCGGSGKDPDCQVIPSDLNKHPGLSNGEAGLLDQYLLSVEGILPFIQYHWNAGIKAKDRYESQKALINERWAYLALLFPLLIGFKVSHSSRELFGGIETSVVRKGFKALGRNSWKVLTTIATAILRIAVSLARHGRRAITVLITMATAILRIVASLSRDTRRAIARRG